jgi:transcriptional regulator with XRE-family HTH domain
MGRVWNNLCMKKIVFRDYSNRLKNVLIGRSLRKFRKSFRVPLRHLESASGYSESYLLYLEHGKRNWNAELIAQYRASVVVAFERNQKKWIDRKEAA